ncbi:hypothetical protein P2318_03955 [Myxococcaceae bacterium GXIMD 01537]
MHRYFKLMDDRRSDDRWHLGGPIDEQGEEIYPWQFKEGQVLDLGGVPRFPLDIPGRPLDFCWAAFSIPVVKARFVQLFERLKVQDVQFIPARIEGHEEPHFILNALRVIRCIDDARSAEVRYWKPEDNRPDREGEYRSVMGMRIDPSKVGDARIFRPWGWTVALVISEDLQRAMEQEGITGTHFVEV